MVAYYRGEDQEVRGLIKGGSMPMEKLQLEVHFVIHRFFPFYGWFGHITEKEADGYRLFKQGDAYVVPNDDPYQIVAIVDDHRQTLNGDILPAIYGVKNLFNASRLDSNDRYTKDIIKIHFVGFNPQTYTKEATLMMMESIIGLGFTYQLG